MCGDMSERFGCSAVFKMNLVHQAPEAVLARGFIYLLFFYYDGNILH